MMKIATSVKNANSSITGIIPNLLILTMSDKNRGTRNKRSILDVITPMMEAVLNLSHSLSSSVRKSCNDFKGYDSRSFFSLMSSHSHFIRFIDNLDAPKVNIQRMDDKASRNSL